MLPGRGREETGDADVEADLRAGCRQRLFRYAVTREDQEPPPSLPLDRDRLHPALYGPVHADLHVPDSLEVDLGCLRLPLAGIPRARPFDRIEAMSRLEPRIARFFAGLDPPEESLECLVQPPQRRLLRPCAPPGDLGSGGPDLGQLGRLGSKRNRPLRSGVRPVVRRTLDDALIGVPALLQRGVVELPVRVQALPESHVLLGCRAQPELVGPPHAASSHWCSM